MNFARHLVACLLSQATALDPGRHNMLHSAGPQAGHIEWLYWFVFWILFAVFILMIAAFTGAGAKARVLARHPLPVIEKDEAADRRAGWAVGTAIGITVVTLFVVLVLSVITGKRVEGMTSQNPLTIQITGHQWWWEITYPNSQADQTVTTANEIHVPVGTPIVVLTSSNDVIHSFWAPNITGKRDLLPGIFVGFFISYRSARNLSRPVRRILRLAACAYGVFDRSGAARSISGLAAATAQVRDRTVHLRSHSRPPGFSYPCLPHVPHDSRHGCRFAPGS